MARHPELKEGDKVGKNWTFVRYVKKDYQGYVLGKILKLRCVCGNVKNLNSRKLKEPHNHSCGCIKRFINVTYDGVVDVRDGKLSGVAIANMFRVSCKFLNQRRNIK